MVSRQVGPGGLQVADAILDVDPKIYQRFFFFLCRTREDVQKPACRRNRLRFDKLHVDRA